MTQFLDCTLRDGGYYNAWDFPADLVTDYLVAMQAVGVDVVELGFRFLKNEGFKGPHAFTTDDYLRGLSIPDNLTVGVMVNGADLCSDLGRDAALRELFPNPAKHSPVDLVRLACHYSELEDVLPAVEWLHRRGYRVGVNLMQISERSESELGHFGRMASATKVEVLYFADSMGGMNPSDTAAVIQCLRKEWNGALGVHAHDNLGLALSNTLRASDEGATWLDATVTGMGRGPGNARTEELAIELGKSRDKSQNFVPLMRLISSHFAPLRARYAWGTNPYYYLAGKHRIHPTYVQRMLSDRRFDPEDIFWVIDYLKGVEAHELSHRTLEFARHFYRKEPHGTWNPINLFQGSSVLLIGPGLGAIQHRDALESYVLREKPIVLSLNAQSIIEESLVTARVACHPIRLLADLNEHLTWRQPLITPASMLPEQVFLKLSGKTLLDYGLDIDPIGFDFGLTFSKIPSSLVIAYALAVATQGDARQILLAGFDGFGANDPRTQEIEEILKKYSEHPNAIDLVAITPTEYTLRRCSVYGMA